MKLAIFYGTALIILIITFIVAFLRKDLELKKRCITLIVLIHLVCLIILSGKIAFTIFMMLVAAISAAEITRRCYSSSQTIMISLLFMLALFLMNQWVAAFWVLQPLAILVYLILIGLKPRFLNNLVQCWACLILVVIPGCTSLCLLFQRDYAHIIALILLVQFNDGFSYLAGKKLGKTRFKFIQSISPGKTLEGYVGGISGILLACLLLNTVISIYPAKDMLLRSLLLFLIVFVFANMGDLAFSSFKRKLGIKDFSNILAGHGGVLDRLDSILFLAPMYLLFIAVVIR